MTSVIFVYHKPEAYGRANPSNSSHTRTISITKGIFPTAHPELPAVVIQAALLQIYYPTMVVLSRLVVCEFFAWPMFGVWYRLWRSKWTQSASLTQRSTIGNLRSLNDLAKQARADYIVHTGDFGFYDESSLERIADK